MRFFVEIVIHQQDSCDPDYQLLHNMLAEAGFEQRLLDGTRAMKACSGFYVRDERVLGLAEIEHDLRFVLRAFAYPCSFRLHHAAESQPLELTVDEQPLPVFPAMFASPATNYLQ